MPGAAPPAGLRRRVLELLVVLAAGYAALCALLLLGRHRLIFPIRGGGLAQPARVGLPAGDVVRIPVPGGDTLAGWLLPAAPRPAGPAPALIWFGGNAEIVVALGPILRAFQPPGVTLLAVDYRGYGASTGRVTVAAAERDAVALYDWLAARDGVDAARVVVYGRSVGSGPALALAASRPVAGVVLESPFTSLRAMARRSFPFVPAFLAGGGFDNRRRIARLRCPVLLIHGGADNLIPAAMSRELLDVARAAGVTAERWEIPGADHNSTYDVGDEEYVRRVRAFVARAVGAPAP
jgi:fermentation-respiration switch protein FrsA (DUF1100 family)